MVVCYLLITDLIDLTVILPIFLPSKAPLPRPNKFEQNQIANITWCFYLIALLQVCTRIDQLWYVFTEVGCLELRCHAMGNVHVWRTTLWGNDRCRGGFFLSPLYITIFLI